MKSLCLILICFVASQGRSAGDASGLKISAAVDIIGSVNVNTKDSARDRIDVREAEILLTGPIDHVFDGLLSFAAHSEKGIARAELHEAFIGSTKLIPRSQFKVGQYFLGVGRLNRFHRHEWPFISAPKVQEKFFGAEGALDTGLEYTVLVPTSFFLAATLGLSNGYTYGHSHNEGERPKVPTHYGRLASYQALPLGGGAELGLNFLQRTAADSTRMTLYGVDFAAKWREGPALNVLLQSELWVRVLEPKATRAEKALGFYLFPQKALTEQTYLGVLWDYYTVLELKDVTGKHLQNNEQKFLPTLTYKASEFSTLRLAYSLAYLAQDGHKTKNEQKIEAQATFIIGAHPAHAF